jgi:DNA-binding PadR family transcriptional regulator
MSLPYGLLGLLSYQSRTGYELTKTFGSSLNNFWHAQSSQIYRELNKMEQKGWVSSQNVIQEGRPNKRVYSITADGQSVLKEWLDEGILEFENRHEPLLMRIFFGADAPEVTLALLKACRDAYISGLEVYAKNIQANITEYASSINDGEKKGIYWQMTLDYGIAQAEATVQWAQRCIEKLEGGIEK